MSNLGLFFWSAVVLVVIAIIGVGVVGTFTESTASACIVTEKDRAASGNGGSDMRVYTENCGTFSVADNWFAGQFASADQYASVKEGETYNFTTRGFRIPILSMFPNIVGIG